VWHDAAWRPPAFHELVIYQLHVGAFWAVDAQGRDKRRQRYGAFLDVIERIAYLCDLGINAIQLLPIQEYAHHEGLAYAGLDFFSPEMPSDVECGRTGAHAVNRMLAAPARRRSPTAIECGPNSSNVSSTCAT
jgi:1,4-alpha-glucan branching enzyme